MTANIETYADQAAFVSARETPWHRLGTVVDHSMTAEEALTLSHLDNWNVRKEGLCTDTFLHVPDNFAVVRDNPFTHEPEAFGGVVGKLWEPVQNEEHAEFLNTLVSESGAHFETAGSLDGGKRVFVSMKMPETMLIGGHDAVDTYVLAVNSHDGQSSFQVITTPVRAVCSNTVAAAFRGAKRVAKVRHTGGQGGAIARVRDALGISFKYVEEFQTEAERMIEAELNTATFNKIVADLYPIVDADTLAGRRAAEHRENVGFLFRSSDTLTEVKGTAWAGYNAVTEYIDHFVDVRGAENGTQKAAEKRALYNLTGSSDALKEQAFKAFASV